MPYAQIQEVREEKTMMMTTPLTPTPVSMLNLSTPSTARRQEKHEQESMHGNSSSSIKSHFSFDGRLTAENDEGDSSPFMSHVKDDNTDATDSASAPAAAATATAAANPASAGPRSRPISRIMSGTELSPLKILQDRQQQQHQLQQQTTGQDQPDESRGSLDEKQPLSSTSSCFNGLVSPRKLSAPIKRFPIKVSAPTPSAAANPMITLPGFAVGPNGRGPDEMPRRASPASPRPEPSRGMSFEEALRGNQGLKHAIDIFEDDYSSIEGGSGYNIEHEENHTFTGATSAARNGDGYGAEVGQVEPLVDADADITTVTAAEDYSNGIDDTMVSTLSSFSALPSLTTLAQMRSGGRSSLSPTKLSMLEGGMTSRGRTDLSPMRTPRAAAPHENGYTNGGRHHPYECSGNTTNLMEFTEKMRFGSYGPQPTPSRRNGDEHAGRISPSKATPQRGSPLVNLLDFDIPPMPTPRSIPTITPRELESLKSGFLSEISSLKASLSGKEAEVASLKTAVGDAEARVGGCLEKLREAEGRTETLAAEREGWERRGREMESVLRQVREEIVLGRREREDLEAKLDEAEKRREAAEMMAQEAESKMAGMRAGKASAEAAAKSPGGPALAASSNKEVEIAVERVARELHALYKSKHETKVAALKKSYEARWEKRMRELQAQVDELRAENEELRLGRNDAMKRTDPAVIGKLEEERQAERARDAACLSEKQADLERLEAMVRTVQADNDVLRSELERERVEKGELVQLAEEMMSMQQTFIAVERERDLETDSGAPTSRNSSIRAGPGSGHAGVSRHAIAVARAPSSGLGTPVSSRTGTRHTPSADRERENVNGVLGGGSINYRHSGGARLSGLRMPGGGKPSGLGRGFGVPHERTRSSASAGSRPGSGQAVRSGIMNSIEKMGSYRGRAE